VTGAGYQSTRRREEYKQIAFEAVTAARLCLADGGTALDAVEMAIVKLENAELMNAGKGSNLDMNGNVSCDASLMDGETGLWGGTGSIYSVRNPISVAKLLIRNQLNPGSKAQSSGLVQPMLLVGKDATDWALDNGCEKAIDLTTS
jgi:taspase (threonine aspartase 1)